ncbi:hypothetical protein MPER_07352 [Moniliophthora perniciosa FA553]|nr:hypothetical protein MPER_07352 [Moniliophthora perniciosa FA553]
MEVGIEDYLHTSQSTIEVMFEGCHRRRKDIFILVRILED